MVLLTSLYSIVKRCLNPTLVLTLFRETLARKYFLYKIPTLSLYYLLLSYRVLAMVLIEVLICLYLISLGGLSNFL